MTYICTKVDKVMTVLINGVSVEIQYRTIYQHAWATAVEVVDSIDNERLKFSEGGEKQQEFFKLISEIIARGYENKTSCKAELSDKELLNAFYTIEKDIGLLDKLKALKAIHKHTEKILEKNAIIIFDATTEKGICTLVKPFNNLKFILSFVNTNWLITKVHYKKNR